MSYNNIVVPEATNEILAGIDPTTTSNFKFLVSSTKVGNISVYVKLTATPMEHSMAQHGFIQDMLLQNVDSLVGNMIKGNINSLPFSFGWSLKGVSVLIEAKLTHTMSPR